MARTRSHKTVYTLDLRTAWRPLAVLLCFVAGIAAGVNSEIGMHPLASQVFPLGPAWESTGIGEDHSVSEVIFTLNDHPCEAEKLNVGLSGNPFEPGDNDLGNNDYIEPHRQSARIRVGESETGEVQFIWPVENRVTDGFGWRTHPVTGKRQFHNGIDIAAPAGTPVRAAAAGTVEFTGWLEGYGRLVIISHGEGCRTKYGHLSRYAVSPGQKVTWGEVIGYVGDTGTATGPHCHFEVEINGRAVNPRDYLP